jgi:hypothetical protein
MTAFVAREVQCGVWAGPVRTPRNSAAHQKGSIHDDATAQQLGFRGGTVAGSLHMEQFPPLLTRLLGSTWWEDGGLSLYFRFATTDLEAVRCFAVAPRPGDDVRRRIEVWMDHENGERVAEGSAHAGGPDPESALRQRIAVTPPARELRILDGLLPGVESRDLPTRVGADQLHARLGVITEPLPEYGASNRWGRPVLPPSLVVRALRAAEAGLLERTGPVVGLFGAIEVQHLDGPLFADEDYVARGRVLAVSDTPKTEYFWYESTVADRTAGVDRASMLMMLRFMKASSPLWR